ncbi:MAG: HAD-IA family hydrolase [Chloroflexota bacterium]|nr:HAD-IA family hydrolase [Chloroflexota bacterium]
MGKIDSIIFDLDGTLVDSQPAAIKSSTQALSAFGVQVSDADIRSQFGGGSRKLLWYFLDRSLGQHKANELIDEVIQRRLELQVSFTDQVTLLPNVKELLESLGVGGFRIALATMSSGDVVQHIMSFHGIGHYFDHVVTVDDVVNVKPDPEILVKTIALLGVNAEQALYCGDSSHDSEAAFRLGMPFLLINSGLYVRGEALQELLLSVEHRGCPVIGLEDMLNIRNVINQIS